MNYWVCKVLQYLVLAPTSAARPDIGLPISFLTSVGDELLRLLHDGANKLACRQGTCERYRLAGP